ncbi:MAG: hypothetical protein ABIH82_01220 [Candidatus Woesearchaeota archaeon]
MCVFGGFNPEIQSRPSACIDFKGDCKTNDVDDEACEALEPHFAEGMAIFSKRASQFHLDRYVRKLIDAVRKYF